MLDSTDWHAVQTRPGREGLAFAALVHKGYEVFLPTSRVRTAGARRVTVTERPLFTGYVFCRSTSAPCGLIVTSPGVLGLVRCGNVPARISDEEIGAIRRLVASGAGVESCPFLAAGTRVHVTGGPLSGVEGIYQFEKGRSRVVISITLLQRSVSVEVERELLVPLKG